MRSLGQVVSTLGMRCIFSLTFYVSHCSHIFKIIFCRNFPLLLSLTLIYFNFLKLLLLFLICNNWLVNIFPPFSLRVSGVYYS